MAKLEITGLQEAKDDINELINLISEADEKLSSLLRKPETIMGNSLDLKNEYEIIIGCFLKKIKDKLGFRLLAE